MKKRFINDFYAFVIYLTLAVLDAVILVVAFLGVSDGPNPIFSKVCFSVLFGGGCLFLFVRWLCVLEVITVGEDRIRSRTLLRTVEIPYDRIEEITEMDARDMGVSGVERVWRITDSLGNSICVIRFKRRKRYVDAIRKRRIDRYWIRAEATDQKETEERL